MYTGSRLAGTLAILAMFSAPVQSANNLLFILDSSGSMWGQLDGAPKMETAKAALSKLIGDLPKDTNVGLMVYGHRIDRNDPSACEDIELLIPIGKINPGAVTRRLESIQPKGKTPISGSLRQTPGAFVGLEGTSKNIVLISDGIETCDGDPCNAAIDLIRSDINLRVHVVGFDISEKDRSQLECIATFGKGKYFPANSTEGFTKAVTDAVKVAQAETNPKPEPTPKVEPKVEPKPAGPILTEVFRDDFDGEELAEHWEVQNPDPDSYIVEEGRLLMMSNSVAGFHSATMPNMLTLKQTLPSGDWDAKITFSGELGADYEWLWLGLRKDEKNFLSSLFYSTKDGASSASSNVVNLRISKHVRGNETKDTVRVWQPNWFNLNHGLILEGLNKIAQL